ncbi:MAG: hypothetical protein FWE09_04365, partial [Treponema sp.]|nr:hypothetical protein [Treponema sp.]
KAEYLVTARLTRDPSYDALISRFDLLPEHNPGLAEPLIGQVRHDKILLFAPPGSGVTKRLMIPSFDARGIASVDGIDQSTGLSSQLFDAPLIYALRSANGLRTREYVVELREVRTRVYVDEKATGHNDGTSWKDAFTSLREAALLAAAFPPEIPAQIWIAQGTYLSSDSGDPSESIPLSPNLSFIGGFSGWEDSPDQRRPGARSTASGDLGGGRIAALLFGSPSAMDGSLSFDGMDFRSAGAAMEARGEGDFSLRGCSFEGIAGTAVTARMGRGDLTFEDVSFVRGRRSVDAEGAGNFALRDGAFANVSGADGAVHLRMGPGDLTFEDVSFVGGQRAIDAEGAGSRVELHRGVFKDLSSNGNGGAVIFSVPYIRMEDEDIPGYYNDLRDFSRYTSVLIRESRFEQISSGGNGGALAIHANSLDIVDTRFIDTSSAGNGGAVYCPISYPSYFGDLPPATCTIRNGTRFENNRAGNMGGAIYAAWSRAYLSLEVSDTVFLNSASASGRSIIAFGSGTFRGCDFINDGRLLAFPAMAGRSQSMFGFWAMSFIGCRFINLTGNSLEGAYVFNSWQNNFTPPDRDVIDIYRMDTFIDLELRDCVFDFGPGTRMGLIAMFGGGEYNDAQGSNIYYAFRGHLFMEGVSVNSNGDTQANLILMVNQPAGSEYRLRGNNTINGRTLNAQTLAIFEAEGTIRRERGATITWAP